MTQARRILVVDDEVDIAFSFKFVLEKNGFATDVFHSPLAALASFRSNVYSIALLDVKMTELNGFELYLKMRAIDPGIRVCFMSAGETYKEDFIKLFPELDKNHMMIKPIENKLFISRVLQLLRD